MYYDRDLGHLNTIINLASFTTITAITIPVKLVVISCLPDLFTSRPPTYWPTYVRGSQTDHVQTITASRIIHLIRGTSVVLKKLAVLS